MPSPGSPDRTMSTPASNDTFWARRTISSRSRGGRPENNGTASSISASNSNSVMVPRGIAATRIPHVEWVEAYYTSALPQTVAGSQEPQVPARPGRGRSIDPLLPLGAVAVAMHSQSSSTSRVRHRIRRTRRIELIGGSQLGAEGKAHQAYPPSADRSAPNRRPSARGARWVIRAGSAGRVPGARGWTARLPERYSRRRATGVTSGHRGGTSNLLAESRPTRRAADLGLCLAGPD
jgi:hypothetical protein